MIRGGSWRVIYQGDLPSWGRGICVKDKYGACESIGFRIVISNKGLDTPRSCIDGDGRVGMSITALSLSSETVLATFTAHGYSICCPFVTTDFTLLSS
jgi:hypothetical protein